MEANRQLFHSDSVLEDLSVLSIESSLLKCPICFCLAKNCMESQCCNSLFCEECIEKIFQLNKTCPCCRKINFLYTPSILMRKIIGSIIIKCTFCQKVHKYLDMSVHYINDHKELLDDTEFIKKHKFLFEMKIYQEKISPELKAKIHSHPLKLTFLNEQTHCYCHGHSFFGLKNCLKRNPSHVLNLEESKQKNIFVYECGSCSIFFCMNCVQKTPNNFPFLTRLHEHPLVWTDRDNGWGCDGRREEGGCKSMSEIYGTDGAVRFRCYKCDYDLCEKCLESSISEEEKKEKKKEKEEISLKEYLLRASIDANVMSESTIFVLYEYDYGYLIPESEILKITFSKILKFHLEIEKLKYESFFTEKLPVLRINNTFHQKNEFIDILKKLVYKENKQYSDFHIIDLCRTHLHFATQYFMWLNPQTNYDYRDRYWFFKNPWRKIEHIWELKKKKDFLRMQGMDNSLAAHSKGNEALLYLEKFLGEKKGFSNKNGDENLSFTDIVVFCYLAELTENAMDSHLNDDLDDKYIRLCDFLMTFRTKIKFDEEKPILKPAIKEEITMDDINTLSPIAFEEKYRKFLIGSIMLVSFITIYAIHLHKNKT